MKTNYAELLQEEQEASQKFSKENFGLMVGDEFPEMVRELAAVKDLPLKVIMHIAVVMLSDPKKLLSAVAREDGGEPDWLAVVRGNMPAFELPFSMFYWGVRIGRRLQRQEDEALRVMEKGA